jgi:hypothetical protein
MPALNLSLKHRQVIHKKLLQTLSSEVQAIAIYSAELRLLRFFQRPTEPYASVLSEEIQHEEVVQEFMRNSGMDGPSGFRQKLDYFSGSLLGSALFLLPHPLRKKVHVWAEKEAGKIYTDCAQFMAKFKQEVPGIDALETSLRHSATQEYAHADKFAQ